MSRAGPPPRGSHRSALHEGARTEVRSTEVT